MKIDYCDEYNHAVIRVTKDELELILGRKFGDKYGNDGCAFNNKLIGKDFDLNVLREAKRSIKIAHELKNKMARDLRGIADDIVQKIEFSMPEIERGKDE